MTTLDPKHAGGPGPLRILDDSSEAEKHAIWSLGLSILSLAFSVFTFVIVLIIAAG